VRDHVVRRALVVAALAIRYALVLVVVLGVLEDDVPGVEQPREYTKTAEQMPRLTHTVKSVSYRVRFVWVGVHQTGAWRCGGENIPPIGGNKKDRTMRKQSVPHMLTVGS
jgi:hypothetical protein